jgi:hypothetical protein
MTTDDRRELIRIRCKIGLIISDPEKVKGMKPEIAEELKSIAEGGNEDV